MKDEQILIYADRVFYQMTVILDGMHLESKPRKGLWKKGTKCIAKHCFDAICKNAEWVSGYPQYIREYLPDAVLVCIFWLKGQIIARYKVDDEENKREQYRVLFKDRSYIEFFYYNNTNDIKLFYRNASGGTSDFAEHGIRLRPIMPERWFESGVF